MKAEDLDRVLDEGKEDIVPYLDMTALRRPNLDQQRVNMDLPMQIRSLAHLPAPAPGCICSRRIPVVKTTG